MNILALDCASKTGWATLIDGKIESGVQDFTKKRGESNGILFLKFNAWLNSMMFFCDKPDDKGLRFNLIVYEQAHHRGGAPTEICVGLTTRVQEFAEKIGAEYMSVHTGELKKATLGKGKASKDDMMEWFKEKVGRDPIDDNEADAYAILMYGCIVMKLESKEGE